ncbi:MAG: hypothetical protein DMG07_13415 [Acidobacteria bacterium]|nr:MAG: hypothetical protein DMG07_13415 [Acidobacteriota bacterium]
MLRLHGRRGEPKPVRFFWRAIFDFGGLFPELPRNEATISINDRCIIQTEQGSRLVIVSGIPLAQYAVGDRMAEAHVMVSLVEQGWADQNDVAGAFGCSARTVRRYQRRFDTGGLAALGRGDGYPSGRRRVPLSREQLVHRLKAQGPDCQLAVRWGVKSSNDRWASSRTQVFRKPTAWSGPAAGTAA